MNTQHILHAAMVLCPVLAVKAQRRSAADYLFAECTVLIYVTSCNLIVFGCMPQARERGVTGQLREAEAACKESDAASRVLKGQLATAQQQSGVFQSEQLEAAAKLQQQVGPVTPCTL